jgi:hypothetical protein
MRSWVVGQEAGSSFMTELNSGGDTQPGVHYAVIESANDEVVTPYTSAFLTVADADVLTALDSARRQNPPCTPIAPIIGG